MENSDKEQEIKDTPETKKKKNWNFRQFIDGNIFVQESIRKQTVYILFLVLLSVIYIHNKYKSESIQVEILRLQKVNKELRDRSVDIAAQLMSLSRESEVIWMVDQKSLGIKELKEPPEKLVIKKK